MANLPFRVSPESRATAYYFTQYMSAGAATVFVGIWFSQRGISSEQIGVINAVPVLVMLLLNVLVGRIADKASDWRQVIVLGAVLAGIIPIALFFVHEFWGILLVWTLASIPISAVGPVVDAATMRLTRRNGTEFGRIRAWGTVGYMAVILATGYLVTWFGGEIFLPLFVGLALLRGVVALFLPNFRAARDERAPAAVTRGAGRLREVMKPWFLLPLVGWSMVFGTHLVLNAFQGLLWSRQGIPEDIIGPLLALGALSEATMMFVFAQFSRRFSARSLILTSSLVAVLRWIAMGLQPGVEFLVPLQLLHSVTFAMGYMGCVNFIANWTSENIAAEAQGFFTVLQQGMSVIALVGFGWLVGMIGAQAYFVAAVFALIGGGLVWLSMRMMQPKAAS